jgi:glycosyltransferase involved in cell wall biosynthesis
MISVIIPSFNSENTIKKCLDSLLNQSYDGGYEIVLVDSSVDRTPQIVSLRYPSVKLIHLGEKTDPGTARNIGIGEAKGDLIAFIDSDCMAEHDWLERIDSAHKSSYSVVGGVVNNGNGGDDLVGWAGYISEFREFLPEQPKRELSHIPTCNISYKRKVFREFGLFQGEYYPQEDLVYNYNLWKNGERILLDPAIQVHHHHRSRLKNFLYHQNKIGVITSKVLKVIQLEGAFIVRNPVMAVFLIPFLPMVKFFRTLFVFLRFQPESIRKRPLVLLLFALGLVFWVTGFARGIYEKSSS